MDLHAAAMSPFTSVLVHGRGKSAVFIDLLRYCTIPAAVTSCVVHP